MFNSTNPLLLYGTALSLAWLIGAGIVLVCLGDWKEALKPNAWGDLFAGLFAPLAFIWLVVTFLLQIASLDATKKATDTLIATERPYVTVGGDYKKNPDKSIFVDKEGNKYFRLEVGNYGRTPAILTAYDVRFGSLAKVRTTPNDVSARNPYPDLLAPTEKHKTVRDDLRIEKGAEVVYGAFWYRSPLGGDDLISCFALLLGEDDTSVQVPGVQPSYIKRD